MQIPHKPVLENERLDALKSFNILDTLPEDIFDHYTILASQICGTPIALISLLDENRQWFKSKVGLDVSETPRDISICGHAILQDDIFEIKDALADERFSQNPLISGAPNIRFYAGMPITTAEGYNLGTICVIDSQPRMLTDQQRDALKRLSKLIMSQIEQRQAKNTILQLNETLYENSQFTQKLIDHVPALISYWNKNLENVYSNIAYEKHIGINIKDMRGKHYLNIFPEYMLNKTYSYIQKALKGENQTFEVSDVIKGKKEYGAIYYTPDLDSNQNVIGVFTLGVNITEIKNAQTKLKITEKALESASEAIFITDVNHQIIYINSGFTNITGYSEQEALGQKTNIFKSYQHDETFYHSLNTTVRNSGVWQGVIINRHKNGALYSVLMTIDSIKNETGNVTNYAASMIDITESQKTKGDLAVTSAMLERTGKIANVGGWEYDFHTETILWSRQMYAIHEIDDYKTPDIDSSITFYTIEAREVVRNAIETCIKEGTPWDLELPFTTAKGKPIWVRTIGEMIKINGVYIKLVGTCQDITERKIQEQEMLSREVGLRNSLVREVHHHIKNNIQGISGLLFNAADEHPLLAEPIHNAISKLNSIAVIHGLQGKDIETQIELGELAFAIVGNIQSIWQKHIQFIKPNPWKTCYLAKNEAVPIALILNELITNAIKHGKNDNGKNVDFEVKLTQISGDIKNNEVHIIITNSGELIGTANNEANNINQAGLKLVNSLMPKNGAYLCFLSDLNQTQVKLKLKHPIVNLCK